MKARLRRLLTMLLVFPVFGMMAIPEGGGGSDSGSGSEGEGANSDSGDSSDKDKNDKDGKGGQKDNDDKSGQNDDKKFTQADVDRIVKDRLARERKKQQDDKKDDKNASNNTSGGGKDSSSGAGGDNSSNEVAKAQEMVETAKATVLMSTAQIEASKLGIDPKYINDVVRLAELGEVEVGDDMKVDEGAVSKALNEVLKRVPVFKKQDDQNGNGFRVGGSGNNNTGGSDNNGWGRNKGNNNNQTKGEANVRSWNKFNR